MEYLAALTTQPLILRGASSNYAPLFIGRKGKIWAILMFLRGFEFYKIHHTQSQTIIIANVCVEPKSSLDNVSRFAAHALSKQENPQ
jgi:hypothetical protein